MALLIKDNCIDCDMCEPECPNQAISYDGDKTKIDPNRCTECQGHYPEPTCMKVCPIDCIIVDPEHQETQEQLLDKFVQLHADTLLEKK
ncbi:YfhL family 4Fe-4S dicluster ferredoxin [Celerinatantimonas diazotrophica]|uniref:4Fe-4S binding protein n=1 Tax=Celerinatantimonas diazotrophica TaxID=412034 RepID=A0A4R1JLQ5_9GAMM|nr:YfhL family 4Fe-4S dicluster ferredoxin [Celerinatantimonas diazotrophica]TCK51994.1 4Fe-4S binding protein [Celerinatantimonas diazotrophica]CAG9296303.1 Ferredoxin YfhL [Celerinatantimonas diazotrophica]